VAKLVVFRGDAVESEIRLAGTVVRIGRHARNDIVLDDSLNGVSRFHAEIRPEGGTYVIVDLNSRNGVWIKGRRIKEKAALTLGVPVTIGAFEVALEDDVSSTEFDVPPVNHPVAAKTAAPVTRKDETGRSASRTMRAPKTATKRPVALWAGAAAVLLLILAIPFVVVRYKSQQAPPTEAVVEPLPSVPPEAPVATPPPLESDPTKTQIAQNLADARAKISAGNFTGALREHLQPVLELEPDNQEALQLKRQADEAIAAAAQAQKAKAVAKPEQPAEPEMPGIARRANEVYADYTARAKRIQTAFAEGKSSLDKLEYASALARFRAVERDQPKYQGVDLLIPETLAKQQKAFDEAMSGGQQNEQAGKLREARMWYQRALEIDPGSTGAREKNQSLVSRMTADASKIFDRATFALKAQDTAGAIRQFQQILDLMLPGDEIREKAAKQLEALKR